MENIELTPSGESAEAIENVNASEDLSDATYDSGSYIEREINTAGSEKVETSMTMLVDSITAGQVVREVDPATGETKTSGGSQKSESSTEEGPLQFDPEEKGVAERTSTEAVIPSEEKNVIDTQYEGERALTDEEKHTVDLSGDSGEGESFPGKVTDPEEMGAGLADSSNLEQQGVEKILPEDRVDAIGMGKYGMIGGKTGMPGHGGMVPDGKGGMKGGNPWSKGSSSSGGGPPVGNYGGGSVGEGGNKTTWKSTHERGGKKAEQEGETSDSCESVKESAKSTAKEESGKGGSGSTTINCADGKTTYNVKYNPSGYSVTKITQKAYTLDGGQAMPYTGSGTGHHEDIPYGPETGPDKEASFLRMINKSAKDTSVGAPGMGSSGSSTFSPDGSSDEDDSGKFYGGLYGSAYRPNNPDDPDYYTPNVLDEALAKIEKK